MKMHAAVASLAFALVGTVSGLAAAEIKALCILPAQHVVEELAPKFEKATGHNLVITYSGSQDMRKRLGANETFDVIIGPRQDLENLSRDGKVMGESVVHLMRSQIGVAVKRGDPKPELTEAGLKNALLKAKAIGASTGSSGEHLTRTLFPQLGIADQVKDKIKVVPSGKSVGTVLASGEADIGIQQVSELIHFKGIDFVGPLPQTMQSTTTYSAALFTKAEQPEAGKDFIRLLVSPEAAQAIRDAGMASER